MANSHPLVRSPLSCDNYQAERAKAIPCFLSNSALQIPEAVNTNEGSSRF